MNAHCPLARPGDIACLGFKDAERDVAGLEALGNGKAGDAGADDDHVWPRYWYHFAEGLICYSAECGLSGLCCVPNSKSVLSYPLYMP